MLSAIKNLIPVTRRSAPMPTKINIGCGYDKRAGYLNIDMEPDCKPDILIKDNDLSSLPQGYFDEVLAHDVLEHIPRASTMTALLDWAALARIGGTLNLQTSNIIGIVEMMKKNDNFEFQYNWTSLMFGNQAHAGDWHFNGFTDKTLKVCLAVAGFDVDEFILTDGWLFSTSTPKVRDWTAPARALSNLSNDQYMQRIYESVLNRPIDDAAANTWHIKLAAGTPRLAPLKIVTASAENLYKTAARMGL